MAGDWIKMRVDLGDDPAVIGISEMLGLSEDTVVGKLHRLWSWADKHTTSGSTNGVTLKWVDRFVSSQGFAEALCKFNWLKIDGDTLIFPNFDRHNGASAKARVEATLRQRLSRKNRDEGVTGLDRVITPRPFVKFVLERDGNRCVYCGHVPTGKESLGVDHLLPLTRGGKDAIENLVSCCNSCNNEKNDRTPEEFGLLPTFLMQNVTYVSQQICDKRVTEPLPEKRREEKKESNTLSVMPDVLDVLGYLNEKANRNYKPVDANAKFVIARFNEGATVDDLKRVIDAKVKEWGNDAKWSKYLRPATLFNAEKFAQYSGETSKALPVGKFDVNEWLKAK